MTITSINALTPDIPIAVYPRGPIGPGADLRLFPLDTPTHIQWRQGNGTWSNLVALSELTGPEGEVGITWRNDWDVSTAYVPRDVVQWENSLWIATEETLNEEPGSLGAPWSILIDGSDIQEDREAAENAVLRAQRWAERGVDDEVEPGSYSALHHSAKASLQRALAEEATSASEAARDKAQQWAEEDEDVPVEGGMFSAKHWALKAETAAGSPASTITVTPTGGLTSTTVQAALEELDSEKAPADHEHEIGGVTGLQAALDGKADDADVDALDERLDTLEGQDLNERLAGVEAGRAPVGSSVNASGLTVDLVNLDADDLLIGIAGVSHNSGTSQALIISYSTDNGSTYTQITNISSNLAAGSVQYNVVTFAGLKTGFAQMISNAGTAASLPIASSPVIAALGPGAPINAIRLAWSAGATFDAGSVSVFGK